MEATTDSVLRLISDNIKLRADLERVTDELEAVRNDRRYVLTRLVATEYAIQTHKSSVTDKGFSSADDRELWATVGE
jgi:hypothetical protein